MYYLPHHGEQEPSHINMLYCASVDNHQWLNGNQSICRLRLLVQAGYVTWERPFLRGSCWLVTPATPLSCWWLFFCFRKVLVLIANLISSSESIVFFPGALPEEDSQDPSWLWKSLSDNIISFTAGSRNSSLRLRVARDHLGGRRSSSWGCGSFWCAFLAFAHNTFSAGKPPTPR